MTTERIENMCGGEGHVIVKRILDAKELNGKCGLYAQVTIEPGCSLDTTNITTKVKHITSFPEKENMMIMEQNVW